MVTEAQVCIATGQPTPAVARPVTTSGVPDQQQDSVPAGQDTGTDTQGTPVLPAQTPVPSRPAAVDPVAQPLHSPAPAGVEEQVADRAVTTVTASVGKPDTARRDTVSRPPRRPATGGPSVRDTILTALRDGISEDDRSALRARVHQVHGNVPADTFRKSRLRAIRDFHEGEGFYP